MAQIETKKTTPAKVKVTAPKKVVAVKAVKKEVAVATPVETVKVGTVLAKYSHSNLKIYPRKLRLLVNDVKKLNPNEALVRLKFTNTNGARLLEKALSIAISNAKNNYKLNPETLQFADFRVDEGQKIKRMDKSHGSRFARGVIMKRHSRLNLVLSGTIAS